MIFWITVLTTAVLLFIGFSIKFNLKDQIQMWKGNKSVVWHDEFPLWCLISSVVVGVVGLIMLFNIIAVNMSVEPDFREFDNYRQSIEVKLESGLYSDEFGILDKEIIHDIRYYNECVLNHQKHNGDFWFGIFYPDKFMELELIEYNIIDQYQN